MIKKLTLLAVVTALLSASLPALAVSDGLTEVREAIAPYRSVATAEAAGYEAFLACHQNPGVGGMGQHYVDFASLDGVLDATHPEALVYQVERNGRLRLVAVEYLFPAELVDPENPPSLFGVEFHPHATLPVWILHAWVMKANPSGTFEDWNPNVGRCP